MGNFWYLKRKSKEEWKRYKTDNCERIKNIYCVMQKKQIHKQILVRLWVLNERLASSLVPLRAEIRESVPALLCFFFITLK